MEKVHTNYARNDYVQVTHAAYSGTTKDEKEYFSG